MTLLRLATQVVVAILAPVFLSRWTSTSSCHNCLIVVADAVVVDCSTEAVDVTLVADATVVL
ncbi:MAG: hypothetical protein AAGA30_11885 [Planctomycetota bacterium]